ncbi:hypothetical protein DL96DRAFT_367858 [Flagelloscypha sp. PMI_526]|nr:hypothetical protein DL96DRAFT_367858 [Flagelloscypha sp. PMI_526]
MDPAQYVHIVCGMYENRKAILNVDVASTQLYLLEYISTVGLESRVIWHARWTWSKFLFLISRYPVIIGSAIELSFETAWDWSPNACYISLGVLSGFRGLSLLGAEAIFTLRTYAIYNNTPKVGWFLGVLYTAMALVAIAIFGLFIYYSDKTGFPWLPPDYPGCLIKPPKQDFLLTMFIVLAGYEAIIAGMMLFAYLSSRGNSKLHRIIYTDAVIFYLIIFVSSLMNIITIVIPSVAQYSIAHFQLVIHSTLACRAVLHIRQEILPGGAAHIPLEVRITQDSVRFREISGVQTTLHREMHILSRRVDDVDDKARDSKERPFPQKGTLDEMDKL